LSRRFEPQTVLEDVGADHFDISYHFRIQWFCFDTVLKRIWDLEEEILMSLDVNGKGKIFTHL
jgi:hypothetical protein